MKTSFAPLILLITLGCGPKQPSAAPRSAASTPWSRSVTPPGPAPCPARPGEGPLDIDAPAPGHQRHGGGGLVVRARARLDPASPIGTPLLFLAADGEALRRFDDAGAFLQAEDAEGALQPHRRGRRAQRTW
ncbi:MAG: hypothetical protein IPN01_21995 [Deltaproteobacteria bacterium]|nr:hypothetical protein [Deltaproteobacteria bacterium]